jgi:hypothetical protein
MEKIAPSKPGIKHLGRRTSGETYDAGLTYLLKQMTAKAWWALGKQVRRETKCRKTHESVAAVLGKRCGVSRSLDAKARTTFWQPRRLQAAHYAGEAAGEANVTVNALGG